jgi:hypothetical protein
MKTLFLVLTFFSGLIVNAQTFSENDSLYLIAFEKYEIQIDSFYTKYSGNDSLYETIYLEYTDLLDSIPKQINGRELIVLTGTNFKKIYHENDKKLIHLQVFPMEINNGQIKITFIPYHGRLEKRNKLHLALSDWTRVYFKYDCRTNKWVYDRTENGGI